MKVMGDDGDELMKEGYCGEQWGGGGGGSGKSQ